MMRLTATGCSLTEKGFVSRAAATQSWGGRNPGTSVANGGLFACPRGTGGLGAVGVDDHRRSVGGVGVAVSGERDVPRRGGRAGTGDRRHNATHGRSAC